MNTDTPNQFTLVTLVDLEVGSEFSLTDNAWRSGALTTNENTIHLTFTSRAAAGTVFFFEYTFMQPDIATVDFIGGTEIAGLGTDGDQILVYQGTASSPNFVFGLSCAINDGFVLTSTGNNTSELPPALQTAGAFVEITDGLDNCQYGGARTGLPFTSYAALVESPANWSTSDDPLMLTVSDFGN